MIETRKTFCRFCHVFCGMEADVENGRVVALRGDRENAVTHGYTCEKGRAEIERLYHHDRLLAPQKRTGDTWQTLAPSQALDEIADRLGGLDDLDIVVDGVTRRATDDGDVITLRRRLVGPKGEATHRTVVTIGGSRARFDERIVVPKDWHDLPRVGVRFEVPAEFDRVEWFGMGPHETYPDRRASGVLRHWRSTVAEQYHEYVVPQEHGAHEATRWFALADGRRGIRVDAAEPLSFSARGHQDAALTGAHTIAELEAASTTEVHVDAAMRGLGTGACGPDTLPPYIVSGGTHAWAWSISAP